MEVKLDTGFILRNVEAAPLSPGHGEGVDSVALSSIGLRGSLVMEPDVRPAEVARGRELFSASGYPPDALINGIANLLAAQWPSDTSIE